MKILEWNVKCAGGSKRYGRKNLMSIFPTDIKLDSSIIILTEFYKLNDFEGFENWLKEQGYNVFTSISCSGQNDILIAVSNSYTATEIINPKERLLNMPNILGVTVTINNKAINIIGVRFFGKYENMKTQFENFIKEIKALGTVIIGGDFNNAKIHGDINDLMTESGINKAYSYVECGQQKKYMQYCYNYHRI